MRHAVTGGILFGTSGPSGQQEPWNFRDCPGLSEHLSGNLSLEDHSLYGRKHHCHADPDSSTVFIVPEEWEKTETFYGF